MALSARDALRGLALAAAILALLGLGYCLGRRAKPAGRVDSAPVVEAIRRVAKLATVEMQVADVVHYSEVKTYLAVFDVPKNATLRLKGTVLGGFDLDKGLEVEASEASKTLRIRLPPAQVLSVDARVEWFDERSGWLNPITPEDRTRWTTWARGNLGRAARDAGLFDKAERNARQLFHETVSAMGWRAEVTVGGPPPAL